MNRSDLSARQRFVLIAFTIVLMGATISAIAFAVSALPADNSMEEVLRSAMVESLTEQVTKICREMLCEPPTVSVLADLSDVFGAFPKKLATSPTVRCHTVPGMAVTADSWPHLAEIYAKSSEGARRIALEMGLSRKGDVLSVDSVFVKSVESYGPPALHLAADGKKKFSFDLCEVSVSLETSQTYVIDVADRRLGAIYEGDGELALKPTCSRAWVMLGDFIEPSVERIPIKRLFFILPNEASEQEPKALVRLKKRLDALHAAESRRTDRECASESTGDFLKLCVGAASPHQGVSAIKGLAPCDGYERAIMVVQTEELGAFAFSFAGERGNETVVMTQPRTRSIVSFWESAGAQHKWVVPRVKHYSFDIRWLPEAMRFDVKCEMALAGVEIGRDIRFMLAPVCNVRRCLINGKSSRFVQKKCSQEERVATSLSSGFAITWIKGWLQVTPPNRLDMTGGTDVSVEYSIDYGNASATDALGASHFYDDAVVLHGDAVRWFPYVGWRPRAPLRTRITVPRGFMGVAIGKSGGKIVKGESDVFTYEADFPMPSSAFVVGKFNEITDDAKRLDGLKRPVISMLSSGQECVAQRYLDVVGAMVDWALKYCGDFPYDELRFVTMPGNRSWATMLVFPNSCLERDVTNFFLMSHEVSHQWWGNAAGTLNMDDQWMVEGAATYFSFLCIEDLNMYISHAALFKRRAGWIRKFDSPPPISTGFRLPSELRMLFYFKGAYVFEMLRMATNDDRHFFATLKRYQQSAVTTGLTEPGIRSSFERAIGHDLSGLFRLYLHKGDLPGVQVEVTDVSAKGNHSTISLSAQITPGGYALPYPIDVYPKSGLAPHRAVVFIGPDFGDYKIEVPFADVSRIVGNPDAMLLVAQPEQEDVELYVAPE